jgi:hypothetical protein
LKDHHGTEALKKGRGLSGAQIPPQLLGTSKDCLNMIRNQIKRR